MEVVVLCTIMSPCGSGRKVKLSVTNTAVGTSKPCDDYCMLPLLLTVSTYCIMNE